MCVLVCQEPAGGYVGGVTAQPLPARILGWACLEGMDASSSSPTNLILEERHWDHRTDSPPCGPLFKAQPTPTPCILLIASPAILLFCSRKASLLKFLSSPFSITAAAHVPRAPPSHPPHQQPPSPAPTSATCPRPPAHHR